MTTPAGPGAAGQDAAPLRPTLTAEQALTRLLELIRSSRYSSDFTPERVSQVMGVEIKTFSPGHHGFGEQVSKDWWYGIEMREKPPTGAPFSFSFNEPPGTSPDMTAICQLDLDKFSAELVAMGFSKTPHYDSAPPAPPPPLPGSDERLPHGQLMDYTFERIKDGRGEMLVIVYPGYALDKQTDTGRECVKMVYIF